MNRNELIRHLRGHGCVFEEEGKKHTHYLGPNGAFASVPRHAEIMRDTARSICDQLGIPRHPSMT